MSSRRRRPSPASPLRWIEDWARVPADASTRLAWPHSALAATADDAIVAFHPRKPELLVFATDGRLERQMAAPVREAHGIVLSIRDGRQSLWLADPGMQRQPANDYRAPTDDEASQVVEVSASDGTVLNELPRPPADLYGDKQYRPTCAVALDQRYGGNGDVWVADGYGRSLVHRFAPDGRHVAVLDGDEGGGRFNCPHALFIDTRRGEPELYVADRAEGRLQVYDLQGRYRRTVGQDFLSRPTWLGSFGDMLFVLEYSPPRLTLLDVQDRFVAYIGEDAAAIERPKWPNRSDERGRIVRPNGIEPGRFNSPHGLAVDSHGSIYVTEWMVGGRTVKLGAA